MVIKIIRGVRNASRAEGLTVVIDVFRAFSTACYIFGNNADRIIPVASIEKARELKINNPKYIICGEKQGYKPNDFDYGNSPSEIKDIDFGGKTVVLSTTFGTLGINKAINASEIITGSFLNLEAIVKYIMSKKPKNVSLICTGDQPKNSRDEDFVCASLINALLNRKQIDFKDEIDGLIKRGYVNIFFDERFKSHPKSDFYLCTILNKFNFVLKVEQFKKDGKQLIKIPQEM